MKILMKEEDSQNICYCSIFSFIGQSKHHALVVGKVAITPSAILRNT